MTHASLFTGIGGFDLAAQWMGWQNIFNCEIDDFCQKVLKKNFPLARQFGDIKQHSFIEYNGKIDVLSAGFPCQPFSIAGKQLGQSHKHYLPGQMLRVVGEVLPKWFVGENVPNILAPKFRQTVDYIATSLEDFGYTCQIFNVPACAAAKFHKRERIWFVAYANRIRREGEKQRMHQAEQKEFNGNQMPVGSLRYDREGNDIPASRILRTGHGLPNGVDRIKALGNAIVPEIAYAFFKTIQQVEDNYL
jgi:DNA (cytosine-5)-methyltransferase 1